MDIPPQDIEAAYKALKEKAKHTEMTNDKRAALADAEKIYQSVLFASAANNIEEICTEAREAIALATQAMDLIPDEKFARLQELHAAYQDLSAHLEMPASQPIFKAAVVKDSVVGRELLEWETKRRNAIETKDADKLIEATENCNRAMENLIASMRSMALRKIAETN
ncbi:MAG TPA: hypothetical protein VI913_01700 [Candidatus Peribacteraceae bacterium]|nr:hypothetical protein [Candidatus Peribacteraceae bacterium]